METGSNHYGIPYSLIKTLRKADVLTGEFLQPVAREDLSEIEARGLAWSDGPCLTERGMAVRSWLMRGAPCAPRQVAGLLEASSSARFPQ